MKVHHGMRSNSVSILLLQLVSSTNKRSAKKANFLVGNTNPAEDLLDRHHPIVDVLRNASRQDNWRLPGSRHMNARRLHQIFKYTGLPSVRDPLHGVRQVPVESREKAEAVLARQVLAS